MRDSYTNRKHCPSHEMWSYERDGRWWGLYLQPKQLDYKLAVGSHVELKWHCECVRAVGRTHHGRYPSKVNVLVASCPAQIRRYGASELLTTLPASRLVYCYRVKHAIGRLESERLWLNRVIRVWSLARFAADREVILFYSDCFTRFLCICHTLTRLAYF